MTAKEYLRQLWWLDHEIDEKYRELEYLRELAAGCSSPEITGMPKGNSGKDKISDVVVRMVDLQTYINFRTDQLIGLKEKIIKQIDEMPDPRNRILLSCRYVRRQKWDEISRRMSYDKSHILKLHKKALAEFESVHPEIRKLRK
ncbi:MAG: DUF1492 domain-containing protein [Parasporobacterium sp.]|nr:DUF1492 domain-containing protein [Parasporobacterium sp.]